MIRSAWRLVGFLIFILGMFVLALGAFIAYNFLNEFLYASDKKGVENLAIFGALLIGLGIVVVFSGFNLTFSKISIQKIILVPWQALMSSGVLILGAMIGFGIYSIYLDNPLVGAGLKGIGMMAGLGAAFIGFGWVQRKKKSRVLFK